LQHKVQYLQHGEQYSFAARSVGTVQEPTF
jgi:hypothetical protein